MKHTVKLEVDPSIIERNLLVIDRPPSPENEGLDILAKLLGHPVDVKPENIPPSIHVRPTPGFCVKTHTLEGDKIFLNICHTPEIPPPPEVSDDELIGILESDQAPTYMVPMSLGALHYEADKSGNICSVYDVAISTQFFEKILTNELFKTFLMTVVMEGIQCKYNLELTLKEEKPYVILKNRKQIGTLQMHRIQKRVPLKPPETKKLIEVLSSNEELRNALDARNNPRPVPVSLKRGAKAAMAVDDNNKLRLFAVAPKNGEVVLMLVLAKIKALSGSDINLDVSSNRLIISCERNETLDCALPLPVQAENAAAEYYVNLQVLKIFLPIENSPNTSCSREDLVETELIGQSQQKGNVKALTFSYKTPT